MNKQFFLFIINGTISAGFHFLILVFFVEILNIKNIAVANIIAGFLAIIISYLGNRYFVFKSSENKIYSQVLKFFVTYIIIIFVNTLFLSLLIFFTGLDYRIAFIITSAILAILSFFINKFIVFNL
jgi:putative flippase GtrA